MEEVKAWTFTVCCAAVVAALAQGLVPTGKTQRQAKLTISLFLLLSLFTASARLDLSALTVSIPAAQEHSYGLLTRPLADGTLSLTRTMLAAQIEQTLGGGMTVCALELKEGEGGVEVDEITFTSFKGRTSGEISGILAGELGIEAQIREVG